MDPGKLFTDLWAWLIALPPDFAFLLSLPFLVALTGLLAELGRRRHAPPDGAHKEVRDTPPSTDGKPG